LVEQRTGDLSFACCFRLRFGGIECDDNGLRVGGVALLARGANGQWTRRDERDLNPELSKLYGFTLDVGRKRTGVDAVAAALSNGELARAQIAALLLRLPDPPKSAGRQLEKLEKHHLADDLVSCGLLKADADWDQEHPRTGEPPNPGWFASTQGAAAAGDPRTCENPAAGASSRSGEAHVVVPPAPTAPATAGSGADEEGLQRPTVLERAFEEQYDHLGPVEFAKQVIQFGDRLARAGANLPPAEKERALAEYTFLEDRLSFWLAYDYTPPTARGNLLSASQFLFQGVVLSGIAQPGHSPKSMLDVAADVWANDNPPLRPRFPADPSLDVAPEAPPAPRSPLAPAKEVEGLGGIVDNGEVGIV